MIDPDQRAIAAACQALGIKLPVRVVFVDGLPSAGEYRGIKRDQHHEIELQEGRPTVAANRALWHELTHAAQCERLGGWNRFQEEYRRQLAEASNSSRDTAKVWLEQILGGIPLEREAKRNEIAVAARCGLWPSAEGYFKSEARLAR